MGWRPFPPLTFTSFPSCLNGSYDTVLFHAVSLYQNLLVLPPSDVYPTTFQPKISPPNVDRIPLHFIHMILTTRHLPPRTILVFYPSQGPD